MMVVLTNGGTCEGWNITSIFFFRDGSGGNFSRLRCCVSPAAFLYPIPIQNAMFFALFILAGELSGIFLMCGVGHVCVVSFSDSLLV
jgi:hypothetical protein